jgi:hypothetical protein
MNENLLSFPLGPNGEYGAVSLALVNGQLVQSTTLSGKALLDALAKKIGGPVPAEIATFIENTFGLK